MFVCRIGRRNNVVATVKANSSRVNQELIVDLSSMEEFFKDKMSSCNKSIFLTALWRVIIVKAYARRKQRPYGS